jgi:hypothetical protein
VRDERGQDSIVHLKPRSKIKRVEGHLIEIVAVIDGTGGWGHIDVRKHEEHGCHKDGATSSTNPLLKEKEQCVNSCGQIHLLFKTWKLQDTQSVGWHS